MRDGGRPFGVTTRYAAQGGQIETRNIDRSIQSANQIERAVKSAIQNLPPIYVVAQDVSQVLEVDSQVKTRARVV